MPKERYFALDPEKQALIHREALIEFGFNTYDSASLTVLVKKCSISKGSIYQYFEDKLELYVFLLSQCVELKKSYSDAIKRPDYQDFWSFYRAVFKAWFDFDKDYPLHSKFLNNAHHNLNSHSTADFYDSYLSETLLAYDKIVAYELHLKHFRPDIDPNIISTFLHTNSLQVFKDISTYYTLEQVNDPDLSLTNIDMDISLRILDFYLELMRTAVATY